jgi:hypothetical protein
MTPALTLRNLALLAAKALSVGLALATALGPASAEVTADPGEATVFLRFACKEEVKEAPPGFDTALFVPQPRHGWGSGAFVREDGLLVTTDHSLAKLAERRPVKVAGETITVGCDREDVAVDVFELRSIDRALRGEPGDYRELATGRDASLADDDVLFLKAETRGLPVPWLCAPEAIALRDFDGMPITTVGVDNDRGQPQYVEREGRATDDWAAGLAWKHLRMEPAAVEGMSGGPVVRSADGALVGIVHGNRISSHPGAAENYFVPLVKFGDRLRQFVDPCADESEAYEIIIDASIQEYDVVRGSTQSPRLLEPIRTRIGEFDTAKVSLGNKLIDMLALRDARTLKVLLRKNELSFSDEVDIAAVGAGAQSIGSFLRVNSFSSSNPLNLDKLFNGDYPGSDPLPQDWIMLTVVSKYGRYKNERIMVNKDGHRYHIDNGYVLNENTELFEFETRPATVLVDGFTFAGLDAEEAEKFALDLENTVRRMVNENSSLKLSPHTVEDLRKITGDMRQMPVNLPGKGFNITEYGVDFIVKGSVILNSFRGDASATRSGRWVPLR